MHYKTFVSMNIAIIGSGETAETYAAGFASAGHEVFIAGKDGDKAAAKPLIAMLDNVYACSIEDAADVADLIIIATPPKDVREVSYWLGDVRRKAIIDATSNVAAPDEELVKTACGIQAITLGSAHIVESLYHQGI